MATYFMHKNKCILIKLYTVSPPLGEPIILRTTEEPQVDRYFVVENSFPFFNSRTEDPPSERVYLKEIYNPMEEN